MAPSARCDEAIPFASADAAPLAQNNLSRLLDHSVTGFRASLCPVPGFRRWRAVTAPRSDDPSTLTYSASLPSTRSGTRLPPHRN